MSEKEIKLNDSLDSDLDDESGNSVVSWIIAAVLIVAGIVFVPMLVNLFF